MSAAVNIFRSVSSVRLPQLPTLNQLIAAGLALVFLVAGYTLWFRDSSLVAITDVTISGDQGDEALVADLHAAATSMTTLHIDQSRLDAIAAKYAAVDKVSIDPSLPHGATVSVTFHKPLAYVMQGSTALGIAGDGTVLRGVAVKTNKVPILDAGVKNGAADAEGREALAALSGAPGPLAKLAESASWDKSTGSTVVLQGGLELRFGPSTRVADKWQAAAAVLADPGLNSASYLDLTVPERPAAGTGA